MIARTTVREAVALGLEELSRTLDLLRTLEEDDWARPTDCTGWDVHDVVAHLVGQCEGAARPDRLLRRVRAARRMAGEARLGNEGDHGDRPGHARPSATRHAGNTAGEARLGNEGDHGDRPGHARPSATRHAGDQPGRSVLDGHNELQVLQRSGTPPQRLIEELEWWGERGIRRLGRVPAALRRMRLSRLFPEAVAMPDDSLDFLIRIIGPRDPWMHRIDICAAVGRPFVPDGHDAKIVEQVVGDLIVTWRGPPASLVLDGPAGGKWLVGQGVPVAEVRCDAIGYCRHASGRPAPKAQVKGERQVGEALLAVKISF